MTNPEVQIVIFVKFRKYHASACDIVLTDLSVYFDEKYFLWRKLTIFDHSWIILQNACVFLSLSQTAIKK